MADITTAELYALGLRSQALANVPPGDVTTQLEASTAWARGYVRARYGSAVVTDLAYKQAIARHATMALLSTRGFDPSNSSGDEAVKLNAEASLRFLRDVSGGNAHLDVVEVEADTFSTALGASAEEFGGILSDVPRMG